MKKSINATIPAQQARPITQQDKMDHSRQRVECMMEQFVEFDDQYLSHRPESNMAQPCILDDANLPSFDRQSLSPAQMRKACEAICKRVQQDSWFNEGAGLCTIINFLDFTQKFGGDTFFLNDTVIYFRGINEENTLGCGFLECYRLDVRVYIGEYNGTTHAFIEAERQNGEFRIAELSEFGLMSTFEVDGHNLGIVMLFDKQYDIEKFVVMPNSPRKKHWPRTDIPADAVLPQNRGGYVIV